MSDIGIIKKSKLEYPFSLRPHSTNSSNSSSPAIPIPHSAIYDSMGFLVWVNHTHVQFAAAARARVLLSSLLSLSLVVVFVVAAAVGGFISRRQTFRSKIAPHRLKLAAALVFLFSLPSTLL